MTSSEVNNSKKIVYIDSFDDSNEDSSNDINISYIVLIDYIER